MRLLQEPMHPGEVLKALYLDPLEMGPIALARRLGVPRTRIERLVKGTTGMTPRHRASPGAGLRHDAGILARPPDQP